MKGIRSAISGVLVALSSPFLTLSLWLVNLLIAMVLAGAFFSILQKSPHEYSALVEGQSVFDWVAWIDLKHQHAALFAHLTQLSGWLVFFGLLCSTFLMGGVLEILDTPKRKFGLQALMGGGAKRFPAFFGLLVMQMAILWGLDYGWNKLLADWLKSSWYETLTDERWYLASTWIEGAVFVLLFFGIVTVFDYARVRTVIEDRSSFVLAAVAGASFVVRHVFSVAMVAGAIGCIHVALMAGAVLAEPLIPGDGWMNILFLFLLHQAYVMLRLGTRVADYSAKIELFRTMRQSKQVSLATPAFEGPPPVEASEESVADILASTKVPEAPETEAPTEES